MALAFVECGWPRVVPQHHRCQNLKIGEQGCQRLDPTVMQKALRRAVFACGVISLATTHSFRHPFATKQLERRQDIRTIQRLVGDKHSKNPMISSHVRNHGPLVGGSPADLLWQNGLL